jgi:endonuclease/exonuclease/phosphatase family metal-dependent hydrolase
MRMAGTSSDTSGIKGIRVGLALALLAFQLAGCSSEAIPEMSAIPEFLKQSPQDIRVMSFNINFDSIFSDDDPQNLEFRSYSKRAEFLRIMSSLGPDIVCLQEINPDRDPGQVSSMLDIALPLGNGKKWQAHSGKDNVIVARFDLMLRAEGQAPYVTLPGFDFGHALALVDLPDADFGKDLYVICAHFQPRSEQEAIRARQEHADSLVSWIRDTRTSQDGLALPAGTPLVILGDLNAYETDPALHVTTLVTGDIVEEGEYGADFAPDWDGTPLTDALPTHNARGAENYTWRNDTGEFDPGALDRILYTDSVIAVSHSFVLDTTVMTEPELAAAGLEVGDVTLDLETGLYDHLPIVIDIRFRDR